MRNNKRAMGRPKQHQPIKSGMFPPPPTTTSGHQTTIPRYSQDLIDVVLIVIEELIHALLHVHHLSLGQL
jgi:hypothetical protein